MWARGFQGEIRAQGGSLARWTEPRRTSWPNMRRFSALAWSLSHYPGAGLTHGLTFLFHLGSLGLDSRPAKASLSGGMIASPSHPVFFSFKVPFLLTPFLL